MKKFSSLLLSKALLLIVALSSLSYSPYAFAAQASKDSVQGYIVAILLFINFVVLPLIFSIALLFFLINAARYFIIEGADKDGREKARKLALYGIGGFVFLVSIWGIVNLFVNGLGISDDTAICPDYLEDWCYSSYQSKGSGGSFNLFDSGSFDESYFDEDW